MKLIANLDVNGNQLRDGEKNIGPVVNTIEPMNADSITLSELRNSILDGGTSVPVNFTFEEFITKLFKKKNAKVSTKGKISSPSITLTTSVTGDLENVSAEVCASTLKARYSMENTITYSSFNDGTAYSNKYTKGESADSPLTKNIGCSTTGSIVWNNTDDDDTNNTNQNTVVTKTTSVDMPVIDTENENESDAVRTSTTLSAGNVTLKQPYTASTNDRATETVGSETLPIFRDSYGGYLYAVGEEKIEAANNVGASKTSAATESITINTWFYSWIKGTRYNESSIDLSGQTISYGDKFIFPYESSADRGLVIYWLVLGDPNYLDPSQYTKETKYVALPSDGTASTIPTLLNSKPATGPWKRYTVVTLNDTFRAERPSGISDVYIKVGSKVKAVGTHTANEIKGHAIKA